MFCGLNDHCLKSNMENLVAKIQCQVFIFAQYSLDEGLVENWEFQPSTFKRLLLQSTSKVPIAPN